MPATICRHCGTRQARPGLKYCSNNCAAAGWRTYQDSVMQRAMTGEGILPREGSLGVCGFCRRWPSLPESNFCSDECREIKQARLSIAQAEGHTLIPVLPERCGFCNSRLSQVGQENIGYCGGTCATLAARWIMILEIGWRIPNSLVCANGCGRGRSASFNPFCSHDCKVGFVRNYNLPEPTAGRSSGHLGLLNYDANPLKYLEFKGEPPNDLFFGVELEIEPLAEGDRDPFISRIYKDFKDFAVCIYDGSLIDGFEIVTAPMSMNYMTDFWTKFFKSVEDGNFQYESYKSMRCSTHIHMSRKAFTPIQIAKVKAFVHSDGNRDFIKNVAVRDLENVWGTRYARINYSYKITDIIKVSDHSVDDLCARMGIRPEELSYYISNINDRQEVRRLLDKFGIKSKAFLESKLLDENRYNSVNLKNKNTVEFRMFRGCNKLSSMLKNLEFCQALYDFTKYNQIPISKYSQDSYKDFVSFVKMYRKEYHHLYKFMKEKLQCA